MKLPYSKLSEIKVKWRFYDAILSMNYAEHGDNAVIKKALMFLLELGFLLIFALTFLYEILLMLI